MIFVLLVIKLLTFAATAPVANETLEDSERALQKSLVRNLTSRYSGIEMPTTIVEKFDLTDRASNQSAGGIHEIPPEIQGHILSFLSASDLLNTNLVNPLYYNLSNQATHFGLMNQTPNFVLEENWMNMALYVFLQKYFEKGILNMDDLLKAVYEIVIRAKVENRYSSVGIVTLRLVAFVYEFQNGPNSHIPFMKLDYLIDVIRKSVKGSLPKFFEIIEKLLPITRRGPGMDEYMKFIKGLYNLISSAATAEEIMAFLRFDPNETLFESDFIKLPLFLRISLFDIILPVCEDEDRFDEAMEIITRCFAFSQTLFDQIDLKCPELLMEVNANMETNLGCRFPPLRKAVIKRFQRPEINGLDYLVSRNSANPFDLRELEKLNPNYEILMKKFLRTYTGTLIELDMIAQMKEAGLFKDIKDIYLRNMIDSCLSSKFRPESMFTLIQ